MFKHCLCPGGGYCCTHVMAHTCDINTGSSARPHTHSGNCLDIYYQNVCSTDCDIICLTETWLNDQCYDHNLFPDYYTVFRLDRLSVNKTRGVGALIALSPRVRSHKRRYDLEFCDECVWVEIPTFDGLNLLIGHHYFLPTLNLKSLLITFVF
jgi:hypothetical protein